LPLPPCPQVSEWHSKQYQATGGPTIGKAVQVDSIKTVLKASMASALETIIFPTAFNVWFQFQLAPLHIGEKQKAEAANELKMASNSVHELRWGLATIAQSPTSLVGTT
jgi:hypothetical protein